MKNQLYQKTYKKQYNFISFFALLVLILSIFQACNWIEPQKVNARRFKAFVRYVIDGDTIVLANGEKVRYLGINAPEIAHYDQPAQPFGMAATKFNKSMVYHKWVIIDTKDEGKDQYGRLLGFIYLKNGTFVNLLLIKNGLAYCDLTCDMPFRDRFINAQRMAMRQRIGIWSLPIKNPAPYYIGNRHSMRFHCPWCPLGRQTSRRNRIIFKNAWDAYWNGYFPCKHCILKELKKGLNYEGKHGKTHSSSTRSNISKTLCRCYSY